LVRFSLLRRVRGMVGTAQAMSMGRGGGVGRVGRAGHWRGELQGGFSAALLAAPLCVSYGLLAFAPLGPDYAGMGVLSGLLAGVVAPILCALLGLRVPQIFIARSISAVVLAAFLAEFALAMQGRVTPILAAQAVLIFVALVGLLELAFGVARMGTLAKFLPAPVTAGFQCGVALVLLVSQVGGILGMAHPGRGLSALSGLAEVRPLAPVIGAITIATAVLVNRWLRRAPALLLALVIGTLAQWLLGQLGATPWLGPTMGSLPLIAPQFDALAHLADSQTIAVFWPLLPAIFGWALTAAVLTTADGLIALRLIEDMTDRKLDTRDELLRLGFANIATALCGGLHAGISTPATVTALHNGARSARASVIAGLTVLLFAALLAPLFGLIPHAALAAMLALVALRMFEPWTVQLGTALLRGERAPDRHLLGMLGTVVLVAGLALLWDLFAAVGTGLAIAVVSFLWRMSRSIIRRAYTGREVQSRNIRAPAVRERLHDQAQRIVVFELEGPLFFGTGEKLVARIEEAMDGQARLVIVDMKRINDVDSTGARILLRAASQFARRDKHLFIAGVPPGHRITQMLASFGITRERQGHYTPPLFNDVDQALEHAENILLDEIDCGQIDARRMPPERLDMLAGCTPDEIAIVTRHLQERRYAAGTTIFNAGDPGDALYAIISGRASVILDIQGNETRLSSISAGAFFGEIALIDRKPRSARVRADTEVDCAILDARAFEALQTEHPAIAIKLLTNLARELSARLRNNNLTIQSLGS